MKHAKYNTDFNTAVSHCPSPSLVELYEAARKQIEDTAFKLEDRELAQQIAMIMAGMAQLPGDAAVRIGRETLPAYHVQQAYKMLDHEHVVEVIRKYRKLTYRIDAVKTYLRTMLYNAVFEGVARLENDIRADMPEFFAE